jgi:hypothetical protein
LKQKTIYNGFEMMDLVRAVTDMDALLQAMFKASVNAAPIYTQWSLILHGRMALGVNVEHDAGAEFLIAGAINSDIEVLRRQMTQEFQPIWSVMVPEVDNDPMRDIMVDPIAWSCNA